MEVERRRLIQEEMSAGGSLTLGQGEKETLKAAQGLCFVQLGEW